MNDEDLFIIRCAQDGNQDAWRRLFNEHFNGVYRYCLHLASGRQALAEDITQQVFITAARKISRFDAGQSTFRFWLFGIARRTYLKLNSKESKGRSCEMPDDVRSPEKDDAQLAVHEVLAQMPTHYCQVLEAKYLQGMTVNQIADTYGYTAKAAESLLTRAREKFAAAYKQALNGERHGCSL